MYFSWNGIIAYQQFKYDFKHICIENACKHNITFYQVNNSNIIDLKYIEITFSHKNQLCYSRVSSLPKNYNINYTKSHYIIQLSPDEVLYANSIDNNIQYGKMYNNIVHFYINANTIYSNAPYTPHIPNFQIGYDKIVNIIKANQLLNEL